MPIKPAIFIAAALLAASPAGASGVAICIGTQEDGNGISDVEAYTLARSDVAGVERGALEQAAEAGFRADYPGNFRIRCLSHSGAGHFVVLRAARSVNGEVHQLIGFGFGASRSAAIEQGQRSFERYPEHRLYLGPGAAPDILEEGRVGA